MRRFENIDKYYVKQKIFALSDTEAKYISSERNYQYRAPIMTSGVSSFQDQSKVLDISYSVPHKNTSNRQSCYQPIVLHFTRLRLQSPPDFNRNRRQQPQYSYDITNDNYSSDLPSRSGSSISHADSSRPPSSTSAHTITESASVATFLQQFSPFDGLKNGNYKIKNLIFLFQKLQVDVTCFLGEHELSFSGHNEVSRSANRGDYMDLLSFLAKYDDTLKNYFINLTTFRGTSNRIQNDLIKCTTDVVMDHIKTKIKKAPFVSIALDETTDVANLSQLSIVMRYVLDGIPQERFLGFLDVTSERTANALLLFVVLSLLPKAMMVLP
ncbi:unnamed protein product [Psylliodes chrysocephalus]|uniref:DUF4371 domain-containing protein n=1 Tax=Psylliodes chrysocephalus TaxID=3402493 RepID=A0A9P0GJC7_9CUCU|nr:unnamed protein product [Psylliodes chrysocephala]